MDHVLKPSKVGIPCGWNPILPAYIVLQFIHSPVAEIEGRIGKDKIRFQCRVQIIEERICGKFPQISFYATNSKIHLSHFPCGRVTVLPEHGNVVDVTLMPFNEFGRLYKHSSRTATRIIDTTTVWLKHFDQCTDNASWCIKLASQFSFRLGKFGKTVFVGSSQYVFGIAMFFHLNIGEQIHDIAQTSFIKFRTGKVLGKNTFQSYILFLNQAHGVVNYRTHFWCMSSFCHNRPARFLGNKEDVFRCIFVLVLFEAVTLSNQCIVFCLETVGDVFKKNQS